MDINIIYMCVRVCVNRTTIVISPRLPSYTYLPFSQKQAPRRQPTKLSSARYLLEPLARKCAQVLSIHAQFCLLFSFFLRFLHSQISMGRPNADRMAGIAVIARSTNPSPRYVSRPFTFGFAHRCKVERTCTRLSAWMISSRKRKILPLFSYERFSFLSAPTLYLS